MMSIEETKIGKAIIRAIDKQLEKEFNGGSRRTYAKVRCTKAEYDIFHDEVDNVRIWKARTDMGNAFRSNNYMSTIMYRDRRFYFIIDDDAKRITVIWL